MAYRPVDFNIIQNEFEKRFPNGNLFQGRNFNYLKLVQHGLSFAMTDAQEKLLKKNPFGSWWFFALKLRYQNRRSKGLNFHPEKSAGILFLEGRRKLKLPTGEEVSPITHIIRESILSSEYSWWDTTGAFEKDADFSLKEMSDWFPTTSAIQHEIFDELKEVLRKIKKSEALSEMEFRYVESAFYVFFISFRRWHALLSIARPKTIVGITHYHNEGCIAAARLLGIKTIELQHGLISKQDLYYVYPKRYSNSLATAIFPNEIWLFGKFWKSVLEQGAESEFMKPLVVGNFIADASAQSSGFTKENRILLCAQKNLTEPYVEWIRFMKRHVLPLHTGWKLIVKMHPLESNTEAYLNEEDYSVEVLPLNSSLAEELSKSKIQVSIYSTTFFDALGKGVRNYSLIDCGFSIDYAMEMVELKLAEPLKVSEDVISKYLEESEFNGNLSREDVFAIFQPRIMNF